MIYVEALAGFAAVILVVVIWRVVIHDKTIRKVRLGVFYEREREDDERRP